MFDKHQLFGSYPELTLVTLPLPGNPVVYVRRLKYRERQAIGNAVNAMNGASEIDKAAELNVRLILATVCDGNGAPFFREEDRDSLRDMEASVIDRLAAEIGRVNRLEESAVDELSKNSVSAPS